MTSDPSSQELSPIKRALLEIRELRAQVETLEQAQNEPVAIIGVGLRFPGGAVDAETFWQLLRDGVDTVIDIPSERWDIQQFYDPDPAKPGKMTTRYGTFLADIDRFDAAFFGISPREATSMDPQQRILLETTWEAVENAGLAPERLFNTQTGVFVGIANNDYFRMVVRDLEKIDTYASTGGTLSVASGRIAYLLGLRGPAISIDTACSSSLTAVHLACQSLHSKECNLALAGGVNLILTPEANINFSKATGMMAHDGRCKTFDAAADGYVRGEGSAMIVLKRLSDALADGDNILAVVRGSAINQDGRSSGLTAPNGPSQEAVIRAALANAGVEPRQVSYVETHGTGTSLGDPIEVQALGAVYGQDRDPARPLQIGSVKTNVGHLEAAAGIAGLLKAVIALQHGYIPPHLHFKTPNPHIAWADYPLAIPTQGMDWEPVDGRRIAGVSSFGFSGTNAHVILEEVPAALETAPEVDPRARLVTLSARSDKALRELAGRYVEFLDQRALTPAEFATAARITGSGRSHYAHRLALSAADAPQLRQRLEAFLAGKETGGWWKGKQESSEPAPVAFLFTGHGSHYVNMGRALYDSEPVFRAMIDRCDALLQGRLPRPLLSVLYPDAAEGSPEYQAAVDCLNDMTYGQPAMFALECALAALWGSWGIRPAAVTGHSLGEYAAAVTAGIFRLEDGLELIAERGRLMQSLPEDGLMVTVFADEASVARLIEPHSADVSIAAINSPETMVISGQREAVLALTDTINAQGIRTKVLNISRAAHSPMVEPMVAPMARACAGKQFSIPEVEFFSAVSGEAVSTEIARADYWPRHLRQTVRFASAVQSMYDAGYRVFIEIGPHPTLINLGQRTLPEGAQLLWLPSLHSKAADRDQIVESAARLYASGASLDWDAFHGQPPHNKIPLPTYPWERKSYWWKSEAPAVAPSSPVWETAVTAGKRQAQQAPLELEISTFPAKWDVLNRLSATYIANALVQLGAFAKSGERHTPHTLLEQFNILPTYQALMARWLMHLTSCGWLQSGEDGAAIAARPLQAQPLEGLQAEAQALFPNAPYLTDYIDDCGQRLASIITGKESPLEMMFPGGSMQRAEDLYQNWAHARYFNHIVGAVAEAVSHANPGRALRLLEIGAGTGATTAAVLPLLPPGRSVYHFTDVSEMFLDRARKKFAAYPFVQYGLLDAEKSGLEQGYGQGQFDVVIAANVIHATRSLSETLQNTRGLLAPGGLLVLFEATTHQPWYDITTGLIEGWQSFGDDLRATSPLLSPAQWEQILRAEGFEDVVSLPPAGSPAEVLGESVILARPLHQGEVVEASLQLDGGHATAEPEPEALPGEALMLRLREALPDERKDILLDLVRSHVIGVLRLDADEAPDRKARLMDLGVDSLMAVELRGRLSLSLNLERKLPATLIFDYPTIEAITDFLLREVLVFDQPEAPAAAAESAKPLPTTSVDIDNLTDEQVEAMLLAKLKKMK